MAADQQEQQQRPGGTVATVPAKTSTEKSKRWPGAPFIDLFWESIAILIKHWFGLNKKIVNVYIDFVDRIIDNAELVGKQVWSFVIEAPLYMLNSILYGVASLYNFFQNEVSVRVNNILFAAAVYSILIPLCACSVSVAILLAVWLTLFGPKLRPVDGKPKPLQSEKYGKHQYAELPDINLHYVEKGQVNKPLIIFLHGFGEFWYTWRKQIEYFSGKYRTVAVDLRGFGESDKPKSTNDYNLNVLIHDLKYLIEYLNPNQQTKCYVVAHGWGAVILYCFLLQYADLVNAYVTLNIVPPYVVKLSFRQILNSWKIYLFQIPSIANAFLRAYLPKYLSDTYEESDDREATDVYAYVLGKPGAFLPQMKYYRANVLIVLAYMTEGVPNLPLNRMPPGLCLYGKDDKLIDETAYRYTAYIPNLQTLKVLRAGFKMTELQADLINKLIDTYFNNLVVRHGVISIGAELYASTHAS